jgi:hypothetical protein
MEKYKKDLKDYNFRPIVAYTRPKNLRELLTRALYGKAAIPQQSKPTDSVIFRLTRSYDRNQLKAPIKHALFHCDDHHELHAEFNSLLESIQSPQFRNFINNHATCTRINITPVQVTHNSTIKCTECKYKNQIISEKRNSRIERELWNITLTSHNALLRKPPMLKRCSNRCSTCPLMWGSSQATNPEGTHFRLMNFDCKKSNVIYIIHCTKCEKNYIGLTTNKLKNRIANHISNVNNKKNTSIARHFNLTGHHISNLKVGIIDHTMNKSDLQIREAHWIQQFHSVHQGINEKDESNYHLDYQAMLISNHFRHSKSCMPYCTHNIVSMKTLDLNFYKTINLLRRKKSAIPLRTSRP